MGVQLMLLAALFVALSNLCMRRSIDAGGSSKGFLMIQLTLVFLVAVFLNPVRTGELSWSTPMALFGFVGGLVLAVMMIALGKALERGPAGLTFAALNASTVMPMILMVMLFGANFGFNYTIYHAMGSLLVVAGLFWAGWEVMRSQKLMQWVGLVFAAFGLHVIFLVFMQWRALFINFPTAPGLFLSMDLSDARSQWFMPMVFLAASLVQIVVYFKANKKWPARSEWMYGVLGGFANGIGTFFMIRSTEVASTWERAMIFPLFSVGVIVACNIWGKWLYREKINWLATSCCIVGVTVGTLDWNALVLGR